MRSAELADIPELARLDRFLQWDLATVNPWGVPVLAATGARLLPASGEIWTSTLVADGKVYIGTRKGDFWVLAAGKQKRVLSSIRLPDPVQSTVVAANGTLYVGTMTRLYALRAGAHGRLTPSAAPPAGHKDRP